MDNILEVKNINTIFKTSNGEINAVNNVSFSIKKGECIGIVGESGAGKSQIFLTIMGLLAKNGRATGEAIFDDVNMINLPTKQLNNIRGSSVSMIFQDPMTSLNPYLTIKKQMIEVLEHHKKLSKKDALDQSIKMLELVGIPEAEKRIKMYPHQFSGGMRQRVMIAMSLLCNPRLLIADEPTTALDVTIQAQILDLLRQLKNEMGMSIALITHDLGVIAGLCDKVIVMYGGRIVEAGSTEDIFYNSRHPYTIGLINSKPKLGIDKSQKLTTIAGSPPNLLDMPKGCAFAPRCSYAHDKCKAQQPLLEKVGEGHSKACFLEKI